jgi:hypothetical protein
MEGLTDTLYSLRVLSFPPEMRSPVVVEKDRAVMGPVCAFMSCTQFRSTTMKEEKIWKEI